MFVFLITQSVTKVTKTIFII
ncbi:Protein of unknown function [Bacillus mycoides]|uniref:Uncharacterized protein n=1 Tax=Bacillus mycoides TaxID=1405 RepID=A0A1G4EZ89_BACMY|nr:Protein of unknown function [Bacillus mycoides]